MDFTFLALMIQVFVEHVSFFAGWDPPQMYLRECGSFGLQTRIQTSDCWDKEAEDALDYYISNGDSYLHFCFLLNLALMTFITNGSRYFLM